MACSSGRPGYHHSRYDVGLDLVGHESEYRRAGSLAGGHKSLGVWAIRTLPSQSATRSNGQRNSSCFVRPQNRLVGLEQLVTFRPVRVLGWQGLHKEQCRQAVLVLHACSLGVYPFLPDRSVDLLPGPPMRSGDGYVSLAGAMCFMLA